MLRPDGSNKILSCSVSMDMRGCVVESFKPGLLFWPRDMYPSWGCTLDTGLGAAAGLFVLRLLAAAGMCSHLASVDCYLPKPWS